MLRLLNPNLIKGSSGVVSDVIGLVATLIVIAVIIGIVYHYHKKGG